MVFIINRMRKVTAQEKAKWLGYTFFFGDGDERRPSHPFHENVLHPPMLINPQCEEKNEAFNLCLNHVDDVVIFEAVKPIVGGEVFIVDYGKEYNQELYDDRQKKRLDRQEELQQRRNLNHNYKCKDCGYTCHNRFRLSHYSTCAGRQLPE